MNLWIVLLLLALNLWQFVAVPLLPSAWAWTIIPLALSSNSLWAAIHEAVHGNLFRNRTANLWAGRALSCVFGSSFTFLSAGHLAHHALNRVDEQLEIVKPGESIWVARARYYFFLCGGLYLSELLVPLAFVVPFFRLSAAAIKDPFTAMLYQRAIFRRPALIGESLAAVAFLAGSAWLYGHRWPIFAAILGARALFISALDYIYHYGNPVGQADAAFNLWLPPSLSRLILHFNLHHTHHRAPRVRWRELPSVARNYQGSFFRAAFRVWRGPVK